MVYNIILIYNFQQLLNEQFFIKTYCSACDLVSTFVFIQFFCIYQTNQYFIIDNHKLMGLINSY
ncbi:hypothetical protein pb186bvf_003535 [Paramecium bursaria]